MSFTCGLYNKVSSMVASENVLEKEPEEQIIYEFENQRFHKVSGLDSRVLRRFSFFYETFHLMPCETTLLKRILFWTGNIFQVSKNWTEICIQNITFYFNWLRKRTDFFARTIKRTNPTSICFAKIRFRLKVFYEVSELEAFFFAT